MAFTRRGGPKITKSIVNRTMANMAVLYGCAEYVPPDALPMPRAKPVHHEHTEQVKVIVWARGARSPAKARLVFAIPNGGNRNEREAVRLKAEGVTAGIPDLCLPVARQGYHGLYIEMKKSVEDGRSTVSTHQKEKIDELIQEGYHVEVCYGSVEAIAVIQSYLGT